MTKISRKELYEKIWTMPSMILAREYGVSDVALGKICRKHKIPKPPPGYWAARRFGKSGTPVPLPEIDDTELQTVTFKKKKQPELIPESMAIRAMAAAERTAAPVTVLERTGTLHPLVAHTKAVMAEAGPDYRGFVRTYGKDCLGMSIGKSNVARAVRIMNALVRAFEARGFPVSSGMDDMRAVTIVTIQGEQVQFRLEEMQKMKKRVRKPGDTYFYEGYDYLASGKLVLIITSLICTGARQRWGDTEKSPIEKRLNSFIAGLIEATEVLKIRRIERERREREWEEERRLRAEAERLQMEKEQRAKEVDRVVANWRKSQAIRSFVDFVIEMRASSREEIKPDSELAKWLTGARQYADELDPVRPDCIVIPEE